MKGRLRKYLAILSRYSSVAALAVVFLVAVIFSPKDQGEIIFLRLDNQINILRQVSETGILAVGMTLVILLGGIDLSVGSVVALTATSSAWLLMDRGMGAGAAILLSLVAAGALGWLNGVIITKGRMQPFVVTLAAMSWDRGLARLLSNGQSIPIAYGTGPGEADPSFSLIVVRLFHDSLPIQALIMLAVAFAAHQWLTRSRMGRHIYAIGGGEKASRLSGVPVRRVKITVFALCGLLAGLAGIIHAAQLEQGNPNDGIGYELDAIAATVIGGTSLMGGVGSITGTLLGTLTIGVIDNALGLIFSLDPRSPHYRIVLKGVIIVVAVLLQRARDEE